MCIRDSTGAMHVLISGVSLLHFKPAKDRGRDTDYRDTDTETETERGGGELSDTLGP